LLADPWHRIVVRLEHYAGVDHIVLQLLLRCPSRGSLIDQPPALPTVE
jgi:hypothetical protein